MISQAFTLTRIFGIFIIQPIVIIFFLFIAIRILRRNRNKLTLTLSLFYFLSAAGFTMNIFFLLSTYFLAETQLLLLIILYFTTDFLIIFSSIFILFFLIHLQWQAFSIRSQLLIGFFYGLGCFILLIIPGGISIGVYTNWIPVFSWEFLIIFCIYFTITIFIPIIILLIKIYSTFEDKSLKRKFVFFAIGILLILATIYGLVLYNTWQDATFRTLWSLISLIVIPAGLLIYYGIAQNL